MPFAQPADYPLPGELAEVAEGLLGHAVLEVGRPSPQHRVEPVQQVGQRPVVCSAGQRPHPCHDRKQGFLRRVGVEVALSRASLAAALDAPAEEVETLIEVDHAGLRLRQP